MVVLRNCGESESDKAIEYSEELDCFYFPPSPTYFPPLPTTFPPSPSYFPLYSPPSPPPPSSSNSSVRYVWGGFEIFVPRNYLDEEIVDLPDFYLALLVEHKIQDRGGALDVIPSGRLVKINELVQGLDDIVDSQAKNAALNYVDDYCLINTADSVYEFKPLEKQNEDIVDQLIVDSVTVAQHLIQYRDGALDSNLLWNFFWTNGSEISDGQLLTSTPEPALIFQTKLSLRLWLGHRGQWVADICYEWNWLNIGALKTAEGAPLSCESVLRYRGGKDLFDYPFSELLVNENSAEPTTKEQENPNEDFELGCSEAMGNDGVEAVGIHSCNCCDSAPIQEVIQSTLKYACREYGIHLWPPHPNKTPMLVDQEEIPLLNSDTLASDQALAATIDTNTVLVKEIQPPLVLPTTQLENLDDDLGNDEVYAAGIGGEGTKEGEIAKAQFNLGAFGKRKRKEKTPRGERGNKKTTPGRNVIPLEKILQVKKMRLTNAAEHLKVRRSALKRACRVYGINIWPPRNKHENIGQSPPNETLAVVEQEGVPQLTSDTLPSDQTSMATVDTNIVAQETPPLQFSPTFQQENPDEDSNNVEVEPVGLGVVRTGKEIVPFKEMHLKDATRELKVIQSTLLVDQEEIPLLNSDTLPSDQPLAATVDTNSFLVKEIPPLLVLPTARQENLDEDFGGEGTKEGEIAEAQFNSAAFGKRKRKEKTPKGERGNKKTTPVRNVIPLEKILQVKKMHLTNAAEHLKVSPSALRCACRENGIKRWPPRDMHETPAIGDEEESTPLASDTIALTATINKNSVAEETTPQQFSPTVRQGNPDEDSVNDEVEEVGMGGVGTGEGEMRRNEKAPRGERGGVRIKIPLDEILKYSHMHIEDAARELKVSKSTLKRICRDYNISRWPPRDEHKHIGQSHPYESPAIVDQERIPPLKSNMSLPANQVSATIDNTHSVTVRAIYQDIRIKFRLSLPWQMVELEQEVKKRLQLEAGAYYIKYKDEDDGLTLIACDEDLKDCISSSSPLGTHLIEIFLSQKVGHEVRVDQL